MSTENIAAFLSAVKESPVLQEQIAKLQQEHTPEVFAEKIAALSTDTGHAVTAEEFATATCQLSEEELQGVAGGFLIALPTPDGKKKVYNNPIW